MTKNENTMSLKFTSTIVVVLIFLMSCNSQSTPINSFTSTPQLRPLIQTTITPTPRPLPTRTPTQVKINLAATANSIGNWRVCNRAEIPRLETDLSPNKEWLLVTCGPDRSSGRRITKIFRLDGSLSWDISFYDVFGATVGRDLGTLEVFHWSKDEKYLYLRPSFCCIDAPDNIFFNFFQDSVSIYRLDLGNGRLTTALQSLPNNDFSGYAVSFSSTDIYLAYVLSDSVRDIHIQNIQTGESKKFSINENYIASGLFAWSPDDRKLVFVATKQGWQPWDDTQPQDSVSYFLLEMETGQLRHLFDQPDIYKPNWISDDRLVLSQLLGDNSLIYDLQSDSLLVITPTPKN